MKTALAQIEAWMIEHVPAMFALHGAGSDAPAEFPLALRTLLGWKSGAAKATKPKPPQLFGDDQTFYALMTVDDIVSTKRKLDAQLAKGAFDTETYTTTNTWVSGWIPFAREGAQNYLVVDTIGSFSGVAGQIVGADITATQRHILAPSLEAFVENYARRLAANGIVTTKTGKLSIKSSIRDGDYPKLKRVERNAKVAPAPPSELALLALVKQRMSGDEVSAAIAAGANVHAVNPQGQTPLHLAAQLATPNPANVLIAAGADVNARDHQGRTPLFEAANQTHLASAVAMIERLRAAGADPSITANNGETAAKAHFIERPPVTAALS